jgi:hypothetical protein
LIQQNIYLESENMSLIYKSLVNGSLLDVSGNGHHGTLTAGTSRGFVKIGAGNSALEIDGVNTKVDTGSDWIGTNNITLSAWVYPKSVGEIYGRIIDKSADTSATNGFNLFIGATGGTAYGVQVNAGTSTASGAGSVVYNSWQHVLVTITSNGVVNFYINGVLSGTANQSSGTPVTGTSIVTIGNRSGATDRTFDGYIANIQIYNTILSVLERNKLYSEFVNAVTSGDITQPVSNFNYSNPTVNRELNIISAYNMQKNNTVLPDISNNFKDGTVTGCFAIEDIYGKQLSLNGADKISFGNLGNVKAVAFRIKLKTTSEKILEGASNTFLTYANAGTLTYSTNFDNAFINGIDTDTIRAGVWQNVVLTSSTARAYSACTLGLNNATYGNFEIQDLRFYSAERTLTDAIKYDNIYAKQVIIEDNFDYGADGITKPIPNWTATSGTWKIGEASADSGSIKSRTKYLENVTAGMIYIPCEFAGTYEFNYYKGADANTSNIAFICDSINSITGNTYAYVIGATEEVAIYRPGTSILSASATGYITNNTWYKLKVTVSTQGVFNYYVNGTLVTPTGVYTNPFTDTAVTTANFFLLDLDAGDRIANLKVYRGVI